MNKFIGSLCVFIVSCLPFVCGGEDDKTSSAAQAYKNAIEFLKESAQARFLNKTRARARTLGEQAAVRVHGPSEILWDSNLRVLGTTASQEGSEYIALLAFFVVDGAVGEDLSCAEWKRAKTHRKEFLGYLEKARDQYDKTNPCLSPKSAEEGLQPELQCVSKEQYSKVVQLYAAPEPYGNDQSIADCANVFGSGSHLNSR